MGLQGNRDVVVVKRADGKATFDICEGLLVDFQGNVINLLEHSNAVEGEQVALLVVVHVFVIGPKAQLQDFKNVPRLRNFAPIQRDQIERVSYSDLL